MLRHRPVTDPTKPVARFLPLPLCFHETSFRCTFWTAIREWKPSIYRRSNHHRHLTIPPSSNHARPAAKKYNESHADAAARLENSASPGYTAIRNNNFKWVKIGHLRTQSRGMSYVFLQDLESLRIDFKVGEAIHYLLQENALLVIVSFDAQLRKWRKLYK